MNIPTKNLQVKPKRLYIYTKDVIRITGKGRGASVALIKSIKAKLNKTHDSNITVLEFCESQGLQIEDVNLFL